MTEFYAHGRATGGGSPMHPPPDDDESDSEDINFVPINLPLHLQVMGPQTTVNESITIGPNASSNGMFLL